MDWWWGWRCGGFGEKGIEGLLDLGGMAGPSTALRYAQDENYIINN